MSDLTDKEREMVAGIIGVPLDEVKDFSKPQRDFMDEIADALDKYIEYYKKEDSKITPHIFMEIISIAIITLVSILPDDNYRRYVILKAYKKLEDMPIDKIKEKINKWRENE